MKFSLIICTYMRPISLLSLLHSISRQTLYPSELLIIDGSTNEETKEILNKYSFEQLHYYKVDEKDRGLTKQRNFGIQKASKDSEVLCFLDDDTVLEPDYFEAIIATYKSDNNITGVAGVAINENRWQKKEPNKNYPSIRYFQFGEYVYPESSRNIIRNILYLQSDALPGIMPQFSHGRTCGYPLTGDNYEVDLLIGMSFSFRKIVFETLKFSTYFEGYGLYEDADFSIRAQQFGKNIICTAAKLSHFHDQSGRPNTYKYGKMVSRNGWYVWRTKYPNPSIKNRYKWNAITLLLAFIRLSNIFTTSKRKEALNEFLGRIVGWFSLFVNKPKTE